MRHDAIAVGYILKRADARPDWLAAAGVQRILSVSNCLAPPPEDLGTETNSFGLFNTPDAALATLGDGEDRADFLMCAIKLVPLALGPEGKRPVSLVDLPDLWGVPLDCEPLPHGFVFIGFDCVSTEWDRNVAGFGCSPLSCNGMGQQIAVNRYCLIDEFERALAVGRGFALEQPEPGIYFVAEVWIEGPARGLDGNGRGR